MGNTRSKDVRKGVPGNVLQERLLIEQLVQKTGLGWLELAQALGNLGVTGHVVSRVSIKGPWHGSAEQLVILCAEGAEGPVVAFHAVDDATTLPQSLARRLSSGKMQWKVDEYAKPNGGNAGAED